MKLSKIFKIPLMCIFYLFSVGFLYAQQWKSPIPLVPSSSVPDLAILKYVPAQKSYVIEYNPDSALKAGPYVTSFFQAHAYGHLHRTHVNKRSLAKEDAKLHFSIAMEAAADIYAVEMLFQQDRSIVLAMLTYLRTTDKEDIESMNRLERASHIENVFNYLALVENSPFVECNHSAHGSDQWPCSHMTKEGTTLHTYDPAPCTHKQHPGGHRALAGKIPNPYIGVPNKRPLPKQAKN